MYKLDSEEVILLSSKKVKGVQKSIYICVSYYRKAFDYVDHNKLLIVLKNAGVHNYLIYLFSNLYDKQEATEYGTNKRLRIEKGYVLFVFNLYAENK